jgi:hypothetical protein
MRSFALGLGLLVVGASVCIDGGPTGEVRADEGKVDLQVTLELAAGRYKITHLYKGSEPRRFVTGATDKNCDGPVDVLLVDGKGITPSSELPCGGLSYRSYKRINPGQGWSLEGTSPVPPGKHRVVARYCATTELLQAVDPKERDIAMPPWWMGCVDSPAVETK